MGTSDSFAKGRDGKHRLDLVEEGVRVSQTIEEEEIVVAEDEVAEDRPVVEAGREVDLGAQKAILGSGLILPEQSPIHVDVPNVAIRSLHEMAGKIRPKQRICVVFELAALGLVGHKDENSWREKTAEILACVD